MQDRFHELDTETLKAQNPILDVAARLGLKVNKQSGTVAVSCLFHSTDKHPSLVLMSNVNRYECKSCGAKGDAINLVQKALGINFIGAIEWLGGDIKHKTFKVEKYTRETYFEDHGINKESQRKFNLHLGHFKGIPTAVIPNNSGKHHRTFSGKNKFLTEGSVTLYKAGELPND